MDKKERIEQANNTLDIFDDGYYFYGNEKISVRELDNESTKQAQLIYEDDTKSKLNPKKKYSDQAFIEVINRSVVDIILREEGKIGVLNFASAYNPGGGFLNGSMAQEESLAYCSNLYYLQKDFVKEFYDFNKSVKSKCYSDRMIYTPNTVFIKDSNFKLLDIPKLANILTSPAVNLGAAIKNREDKKICVNVMKNRMRKILSVLSYYDNDTIVLGAFGCGVFKNEPKDVARYWKELLFNEGWCWSFKKIIFAVYDTTDKRETINVFENEFIF